MTQLSESNPFLAGDPGVRGGLDDGSPFRSAAAPVASDGDGDGDYVMIRAGQSQDVAGCEVPELDAVEVTITWGSTILHAAHLCPPRPFRLGEGAGEVDFVVPADRLGARQATIVDVVDGEPWAMAPPAATSSAGRCALRRGDRVEYTMGDLQVAVGLVAAGRPAERGVLSRIDRSAAASFGMSALAHAAILGALAAFVPSLGLTPDDSTDRDRIQLIQQYLSASAEREREVVEDEAAASPGDAPADENEGSAQGARGSAGRMGKPTVEAANRRAAWHGPADNPAPEVPRSVALEQARTFGLIGLLNGGIANDPNQVTAPWGSDTAHGADPLSAIGNPWGDDIGDSWGVNGLSYVGTDEGGGHRGETVGLAGIGTCTGTICRGGLRRSGKSRGPGHVTKGPRLRPAGDTTVSGRLPRETIQRVVRQSFGRFRSCYEAGLRTNPNLEGRVTARFAISRDGSVMNVSNGGSDLPDSGVVACVLRAYYGLSFPSPDGGVVTVSYPIAFSPAG